MCLITTASNTTKLHLLKGRQAIFLVVKDPKSWLNLLDCSAGDSLYIWDPHGHYLSASGKKGSSSSAAKQYHHVGGESNLVARFADQFAAWDFGGPSADVRSKIDCTLIRLPLRSISQAQSSALCTVRPVYTKMK